MSDGSRQTICRQPNGDWAVINAPAPAVINQEPATTPSSLSTPGSIAQQQQTSPLPLSSSNWSASESNGNFTDTGASGQQKIEMILRQNSRHFELFFTGFQSSIQAGSTVAFTVTFDNGQLMSFVGASEGNNIQVTLNDGDVAAWTHNMTAGHSMVISFSGIQENPWSISLSGTTPTITAMAEGINQAGISGLPNPWSTGTRNAQPSAQLGITPNPSTPSQPPTPQPKNTNSLSPLTTASIIHGLTSSANGQSVIDIENNYSGLACSGDSTICSFGTNKTPQALCPAAAPCDNLSLFADGTRIVGYVADFSDPEWASLLRATTLALGVPQQKTVNVMNMRNDYWTWVQPGGSELTFITASGTNFYGAPLNTHSIGIFPSDSDTSH